MDPEPKTWITETAAGLANLATNTRALRDELADMRRVVEARYKIEDSRRAEREARCREAQVEHAQIVAERQQRMNASRDQQTSHSQSVHGTRAATQRVVEELQQMHEERLASIRTFLLDCKTVHEENLNLIKDAIRGRRGHN